MVARRWMVAGVLVVLLPAGARAVEALQVEFRPTDAANAYHVEVRGVVDAPILAVRHAVLNNCEFKDSYAYVAECSLFQVQGDSAWVYTVVDAPVLDPRDYIIRRTVEQDLNPDGSGMLSVVFQEDPARGPLERSGIVRVRLTRGRYRLEPVDGGKRTRVTYDLTCDPGGRVPLWMARLAAGRAAPEHMRRTELLAQQIQRRGQPGVPVEGAPWSTVKMSPLSHPRAGPP